MENEKKVMELSINDVLPNRFQPRIKFDENSINELAQSIKKYGVIQPIVVRKIGDKYEIIAGERRYKASVIAGKLTIPAIVSDLSDNDSVEIALIENVQREDLTPIEKAISYKKILDMGYMNQEDLAKKIGKSQSSIANTLRLLGLSDEVQEALLENKISERHARSLLRLKSDSKQVEMLNRIIDERLTVRKADEEIDAMLNNNETPITNEHLDEVVTIPDQPKLQEVAPGFMDIEKIETQAKDIQIPERPTADVGNLLQADPNLVSEPIENKDEDILIPGKFFNFFDDDKEDKEEASSNEFSFDNYLNTKQPEIPSFEMPELQSETLKEETPVIEQTLPVIETADVEIPVYNTPEVPLYEEIAAIPVQETPTITTPVVEQKLPSNETINVEIPAYNEPIVPLYEEIAAIPVQETQSIEVPAMEQLPEYEPATTEIPTVNVPIVPFYEEVAAMPVQEKQIVEAPVVEQLPVYESAPNVEKIPTFEMPIMAEQKPAITPLYDEEVTPIYDTPVKETSPVTPSIYEENIVTDLPNVTINEPIQQPQVEVKAAVVEPQTTKTSYMTNDIKTAINTIRDCANTLERYGFNLDVEEIDFEDMYQVIFKIAK